MTRKRVAIVTIAFGAAGFGLVSVLGAFLFDDLTVFYRLWGASLGLLQVIAGWFVFRERHLGVALLWVAAVLYTSVNLVPAFQRHGMEAFSVLMSAFYVSVAIRVAFATFAHWLVGPRHG
jgi:uncharacterized membrane protein